MTIPARHAGAPFVDGENLTGTDLETDISNIVGALGSIDDTNVAAGANISGSKLADASIATAKFVDLAVTTAKLNDLAATTAKLAANAATKIAIATSASSVVLTTSYQDLASLAHTTGTAAGPIFILYMGRVTNTAAAVSQVSFRILRDSTTLKTFSNYEYRTNGSIYPVTLIWLDTGLTASTAYTFKVQAALNTFGTTAVDDHVIIVGEFRK